MLSVGNLAPTGALPQSCNSHADPELGRKGDLPATRRYLRARFLSNGIYGNCEPVDVRVEPAQYFSLKILAPLPINLLHVVTGPPARRVK